MEHTFRLLTPIHLYSAYIHYKGGLNLSFLSSAAGVLFAMAAGLDPAAGLGTVSEGVLALLLSFLNASEIMSPGKRSYVCMYV